MAARPLDRAILQAAADALARFNGNASHAAESLGLSRTTLQSRIGMLKRNGVTLPKPESTRPAESTLVSGDTCELTRTTTTRVKTLADLIWVCDIDTETWEVDRYVCNKWEMGSVPRAVGESKAWRRANTEPVITELYQVKVWLKRRVVAIAARSEIADLLADAKRRMPKVARARLPKRAATGYMLELSIPDLHLGKLAWADETGHDHYDTKIAEKLFDEALAALLHRTSSYAFDRILFTIGNDLLNSDNKQNTTTAGTPMSSDSRYHKTFRVARRMITRAIEQLRLLAPVDVIAVPGNHDTLAVWHLGDSLDAYFHHAKDVAIDNTPTTRKYYQFGQVMLMFTHGDKGKKPDYPLLMATERPKMFGATIHREAHTGHLHKTQVDEFKGVKVRISPALCPADAWHAEFGFVGNARSAEAFIWHKDDGLVGTAIYTAPRDGSEAA